MEIPRPSRLFVALDPPPPTRALMHALGRQAGEATGGRPVPRPALHMTLAFLGAVDPDAGDALLQAFREALAGPAIAAAFSGLATRPRGRRPRLVALELDDPGGEAARRAGRLRALLERAVGAVPDARPLWPHVTLVRLPRGTSGAPGTLPDVPEHVFDFSRAALYHSDTSGGGPSRYVALGALRLG